jgi:hypothetical protein
MNDKPPDFEPPKKASARTFWILLMAPTFLAIISGFCATEGTRDFGALVGWGAFFVGIASTIYCSRWLALRFAKPGAGRIALGTATFFVIGVINLIVAVAGCAGNISLH